MMIKELKLTKRRKLLGAVAICVALITGSTIIWQLGQVAEAAILDPHPGLVGWWRFDEEDGTIAEDSSGYGNHGTIYGATSVDGKCGKALSFDGTNDYVDCRAGESLTLTENFTIEGWFKTSSVPDYPAIYARYYGGSATGKYSAIAFLKDGKLQAIIADGASFESVSSAAEYDDGKWHHAAFTLSSTQLILYIDGAAETPTTRTINPGSNPAETRHVGKYAANYFNGIIDEVRIYNRALSAAEIEDIFQKGPGFSSRLLAKVSKGTTEFIVTLSWQGDGSINVTIESPSKIYMEDMVPLYQRTVYSTAGGDMLNIKRLAVSVAALSSDENWYIMLEFDDVEDYKITVEVQK